jgi:enamine deaminase RidA (YjgF/YER057c/UK114 family)
LEEPVSTDLTFCSPSNLPWYQGRPASPAVRAGDLLFISGQIALDVAGDVLAGGDVRAQARLAFESVQALVESAGGRMADVVDVMSFHADVREMDGVFEVAREFFSGDYPAWTPVGAVGLQAPGALVSIRAIAHLGPEPKHCHTPDTIAWWRRLPISAGCRKGSLAFIGGQVAADPDGEVTVPGDHAAQSRYAFNRIREVLAGLGGSLDDVIDLLSFHQDARGMADGGKVQRALFQDVPKGEVPAWTAIGTPGLYRPGLLACWRAIADLAEGPRIAKTPDSLWWRIDPISGGTRKKGGSLIAISGEVASDGDGEITTPGDTAAQARYAFNRIREVLAQFDVGMDRIVEVTSFHKDPRAWEVVMEVGKGYFSAEGPAWTPVGTTGLFREGYLHEIYALAVV